MLIEFFKYLATPASKLAKSFGYSAEMVALEARHRRCRQAWAGHLGNSKALVLEAAGLCSRRERAVIIGSGLLNDVPIDELCRMFREVVLVDMVHVRKIRRLAREKSCVRLVEADVTDLASTVRRIMSGRDKPELSVPVPAWEFAGESDLTVSLNILSQLPLSFRSWLADRPGYSESELTTFARSMLLSHLDRLQACPGVACLITDLRRLTSPPDGPKGEFPSDSRQESALGGLELPFAGRVWNWDICPRPEMYPDRDRRNVVMGVADVRSPENAAAYAAWRETVRF